MVETSKIFGAISLRCQGLDSDFVPIHLQEEKPVNIAILRKIATRFRVTVLLSSILDRGHIKQLGGFE